MTFISALTVPAVTPDPHVVIAQSEAAKLLGVEWRGAKRMVGLGLLTVTHTEHNQDYVCVPQPLSRMILYNNYIDSLPRVLDIIGLDHLRRVRRILGITADYPYPDFVLDSVYLLLERINNFSYEETIGLIAIPENGFAPFLQFFDRKRAGRRHRFLKNNTGEPKSLARALLPTDLSKLPKTCLCEREGERYEVPLLSHLNRFTEYGALRTGFTLFLLLKIASVPCPGSVDSAVPMLDRIDDLWSTHCNDRELNSENFTEVLRHYLVGDVGVDVLDCRCPYEVVGYYLSIERYLLDRVATFSPPYRALLERSLPPRTQFSEDEISAIQGVLEDNRIEGVATRKKAARIVKNHLTELIEIADNRRKQVRYAGDSIRAVLEKMEPSEDFCDFFLKLDPLDDKGFTTAKTVSVELRVWRAGKAAESVRQDLKQLPRAKIYSLDRLRAYHNNADRMVDEKHPLVEIIGPIVPEKLPWCFRILAAQTTSFPGNLSLESKEKRFKLIEEWGLPGFRPSRGGFLKFSHSDELVCKYAVHVGRAFVPIFEFERAIRYAALFFDCSTETSRRLHEILQLDAGNMKRTEDGKAFEHEVIQKRPPRPSSEHPEKLDLTLNDKTVEEAMDLDDLQKDHFGWSEMPLVMPERPDSQKVPPAKFCFSFNGKMIGKTPLHTFLRYLFLGWPSVTSHLVRHAEAEECADDEVPTSIVGAGLGQVTEEVTEHYMGIEKGPKIISEPDAVRRVNKAEKRAQSRQRKAPS